MGLVLLVHILTIVVLWLAVLEKKKRPNTFYVLMQEIFWDKKSARTLHISTADILTYDCSKLTGVLTIFFEKILLLHTNSL